MEIIAIFNHKGGVGKTTSAINLGAALSQQYKTCLIDLDPQAHLTKSLGIGQTPELYNYFMGKGEDLINPISYKNNLDVVPGDFDLSVAENGMATQAASVYKMKKLMKRHIFEKYDYILIDCAPSLGMLTQNALGAADSVIIPVQSEGLAYGGMMELMNKGIEPIKEFINKDLKIKAVFCTRYDNRKCLNRDIYEMLGEQYPDFFCKTRIRENVTIAEAPMNKMDVISYAPNSNGAQDYIHLMNEIFN